MLPVIVRSNDVGAATLTAQKGSLIAVLKQVLVNGVTPRSCTITRTGSVANVALTGHGFASYQNVTIAGANQPEYNGQFPILAIVDANNFTIAVSGSPVTPATGTITAGLQAAGWTVAIEDVPNFKIIFRNDSVAGSGRYFRFQEDGYCSFDPAQTDYYRGNTFTHMAHLCGCASYSDINTPVAPFPRVLAGGTLHDNYAYGVGIAKSLDASSPTNARPWMVVADNRTCHIFTTSATVATTVMPTSNAVPRGENRRGVISFGDFRSVAPGNVILAKAYVVGGDLRAFNIYTGGSSQGLYSGTGHPVMKPSKACYLDSSLENSANTVRGLIKCEYGHNTQRASYWYGGSCLPTVAEGEYTHFPSPSTLDFDTERLFIAEDLEDPIRQNISTDNFMRYAQGWIPGLNVSQHTTEVSSAYKVGPELSLVVDSSGKRFLIYSMLQWIPNQIFQDTISAGLMAISVDDWWV